MAPRAGLQKAMTIGDALLEPAPRETKEQKEGHTKARVVEKKIEEGAPEVRAHDRAMQAGAHHAASSALTGHGPTGGRRVC